MLFVKKKKQQQKNNENKYYYTLLYNNDDIVNSKKPRAKSYYGTCDEVGRAKSQELLPTKFHYDFSTLSAF